MQFLREDNKNKSIMVQNLLENENILFRNKNERNRQYDEDVNNDKIDFSSDETLYHVPKLLRSLKHYMQHRNE